MGPTEKKPPFTGYVWPRDTVLSALAMLKAELPDAMAEVERIERTTADLRGSKAWKAIEDALFAHLRGRDRRHVWWLAAQVREEIRTQLGLTQSNE